MEQNFRRAAAQRDLLGVSRPIMLDALDGACHRAYGSMPNMTWIFTRSSLPIYKSDWTDANSVENAIQYSLDVSDRPLARAARLPQPGLRGLLQGPGAQRPQSSMQEFRDAFGG